MFYTPFEQFLTVPLFIFCFDTFDFTFSNASLCLSILLFSMLYSLRLGLNTTPHVTLYAIPTMVETYIFLFYLVIQAIIEKHVHIRIYQQVIFPLTFSLGIFLLFLNLSGNLPLFMSLTSQFAIIAAFCLSTFFGIFFWFLVERQVTFLRTFYAPGTEITLAIVLFPVELLTYIMRPISIICRLCSNIMSGHVIVKVCLQTILTFSHTLNSSSILFSVTVSILVLQIIPLLLLEFCVSLIQVYVFLVIFCMFLSDTFGHHYSH
jgi:F-type H+-transporting ATPase subunit a